VLRNAIGNKTKQPLKMGIRQLKAGLKIKEVQEEK
jgi:hypothetical protein